MSSADGNRLLSDSGVGNVVTRGFVEIHTTIFMKRINKENNVNNIVKKYNSGFVSSPVDVSFI